MSWKRGIYYSLSPKLRRIARRLYYYPIDIIEGITGKRDAITPPKGKIFIGPGDFKYLGNKLKNDFIKYGGLQPHHHVLDIGCGIGRIAIPLTEYLSSAG
ncbi:MAG: class I SAM-dependent methyltransferase, partial [Bacteroidia bacterium]|nr:class I SAM-dependent methyltransferase [Bacteroidia bacterium]